MTHGNMDGGHDMCHVPRQLSSMVTPVNIVMCSVHLVACGVESGHITATSQMNSSITRKATRKL